MEPGSLTRAARIHERLEAGLWRDMQGRQGGGSFFFCLGVIIMLIDLHRIIL